MYLVMLPIMFSICSDMSDTFLSVSIWILIPCYTYSLYLLC
ncbi:hypothetical protein HanIR_Chr10g0482841 [Helianthus annuus]|nr:hypothetical protein HanIR_Chr10g0482841 [Helianthus annuus]